MPISRMSLVSLSVLALAGLGILAFAWSGGTESSAQDNRAAEDLASKAIVADTLRCTDAAEEPNFDTYGLGESYGDLGLVETLRRCDTPYPGERVAANYVSYIYGDCELEQVGDDRLGCQPPLEIQTWPSCHRSLADYPEGTVESRSTRLSNLNGAQRYQFGKDWIEIYSQDETIVLFSTDPDTLRAAADRVGEQSYVASRAWLDQSEAQGRILDEIQIDRAEVSEAVSGAVEGALECL
jgi:hypothetical protein